MKSYKHLPKDLTKAVENTHNTIELLTILQDDDRPTALDADALESINFDLLEIN